MAADEEEFDYLRNGSYKRTKRRPISFRPEEHGKLRMLQETAIGHPRIALGGSTLLLSFVVDVAIHDPFVTVLGLAAAAVIGWKGEDLMQIFVPDLIKKQLVRTLTVSLTTFWKATPSTPTKALTPNSSDSSIYHRLTGPKLGKRTKLLMHFPPNESKLLHRKRELVRRIAAVD